MLKILETLFCKHNYKFVTGQAVYMTKCQYEQYCTKCDKTKSWSASIMFLDFEKEIKRTGQEIRNGNITDYMPQPKEGDSQLYKRGNEYFIKMDYKDHYIYQVGEHMWRVKKDKDDSFALHDGYLATEDDAKRFVDDR